MAILIIIALTALVAFFWTRDKNLSPEARATRMIVLLLIGGASVFGAVQLRHHIQAQHAREAEQQSHRSIELRLCELHAADNTTTDDEATANLAACGDAYSSPSP